MRSKTYTLEELTDSRMLMEHRLLPVSIWFIYILIALVLSFLIWANIGEVDVVVRGRGALRPSETVGTVTNKVTGRVVELGASRGEDVKKGDLLLRIDDADLKLQQEALLLEKQQFELDLQMTAKFVTGIEQGYNPFDKATEEAYYYQFEKYQIDQQVNTENMSLGQSRIGRAEKELSELNQLSALVKKNVKWGQGLSGSASVSEQYRKYKLELDAYSRKLDEAERQLKAAKELLKSGSISRSELEASQLARDNAKDGLDGYKSGYEISLKSSVEQLESKLIEYRADQAKLSASGSSGSQVENGGLVNWQSQKVALEKNLATTQKKLEAVALSLSQCVVKSELDGLYNPVSEFAIGDTLASGSQIGTVVPQTSEQFLAELAVGNYDVSRIKQGDTVKLKLDALPYKEYGFVKGKIITISPDASFDEKSGQSYYKVVALVPNCTLKSYKGTDKQLKAGMAFEAHIVTERKKIVKIVLEKLQLSL